MNGPISRRLELLEQRLGVTQEPDDDADDEDRRELCPEKRARLEALLRERREQELGRNMTAAEVAALAAPAPHDPALPRLRFGPTSRARIEAMLAERGSPSSPPTGGN
jgi:hypothetical protein